MIRDRFLAREIADNVFQYDLSKHVLKDGKNAIPVTVETGENALLFSSLKAFGK